MISRSVRRMHILYSKCPSDLLLIKILRANERLASEHDIDQHVIRGLNIAIKNEKKRRQRGKRLNLLGQETSGPQFFSPTKIQAARDTLDAKETEKQQKQLDLGEKRALAAVVKVQKEMEKAERMEKAKEKRKLAAEAKKIKEAEKRAEKEAKMRASRPGGEGSTSRNQDSEASSPKKKGKIKASVIRPPMVVEEVEEVNLATARGRQVRRPKKFGS